MSRLIAVRADVILNLNVIARMGSNPELRTSAALYKILTDLDVTIRRVRKVVEEKRTKEKIDFLKVILAWKHTGELKLLESRLRYAYEHLVLIISTESHDKAAAIQGRVAEVDYKLDEILQNQANQHEILKVLEEAREKDRRALLDEVHRLHQLYKNKSEQEFLKELNLNPQDVLSVSFPLVMVCAPTTCNESGALLITNTAHHSIFSGQRRDS
jgi:hypothetical protein